MPSSTDNRLNVCNGDLDDHCCHLGRHGVCSYLVETSGPRRWTCSLRAKLGSWDKVHKSEEYLKDVRPLLYDIGIAVDCGDWPLQGDTCGTCGVGN